MSVDDVLRALQSVQDPELGRSVVELGMVRDVVDEPDKIGATIVLTTAGCPLRGQIRADAERALQPLAAGRVVDVRLDAMTKAQREALGDALASRGQLVKTLFGPGSCTRTIAVASGKGGVGKSTVAANLAVALAAAGAAVGLIDADIYGPTIPLMLGLPPERPAVHDGKLLPPERFGVKVVSIGLFLAEDEPVVWRGPMLGRAIEQFLADVAWGSPDYLLIDLPPGTGDVALSIAQMLPEAEMLIVTTPQDAAARTAAKAARMASLTGHRVLGVVENMSYFDCPTCGARHHLFGRGGAAEIAESARAELLARIPFDETAREAGDAGEPPALRPQTAVGAAFAALAAEIAGLTRPPSPSAD